MVRGRFAVPLQSCNFSLILKYSNKNYVLIDRQRIMVYHDINHVNVENEIEV